MLWPRIAAFASRQGAFALLVLTAVVSGTAWGGEKPVVTFAGVAYTSAAADTQRLLPRTHAALARYGEDRFSQDLGVALRQQPSSGFQLSEGTLASLHGAGSPLVMALALDRETITSERIAGQTKLLFEVAAQALFFDFREKQVLFAYPVTLQYIEVLDGEPTSAQIDAVADHIVAGTGPAGILSVFPRELASLALPSPSSRRLQVTEVRLSDGGRAKLPEQQRDETLVGHEFTKMLASTLRLPMLPHARGQAIGGAMATRFADGSVLNLQIPTADYRVVLEVEDFREKTLSETPALRQQLYGAFFRIRVEEPLSSTVYFDQRLRQGSTKAIPASQDQVDSAASYYETLLTGLASFAQAADGGARPWAGEQTGGRQFISQIKSLKELIRSCR